MLKTNIGKYCNVKFYVISKTTDFENQLSIESHTHH